MKVNAVFGAGIAGKSYVVTRQRRLNCYYEDRNDGDKAKVVLYGTPGMKSHISIGNGNTPARGLLGSPGFISAVAGNTYYQLNAQGTTMASGDLQTLSGLVCIAQNPTQVLTVDGVSGYIFLPATRSFLPINATNYPNSLGFPSGCRTITNASGFFVCEVPGTQQFQVSNLFDGTTWNPLAFASASQYSDILLAVDSLIGNLILLSGTHLEFWQNTGGTPQPFAPILSATSEWGIAAIFSRAHVSGTLIFLGQSPQGGVSVIQIAGYQVTPISTPDLDYILSTFSTVSDAVALTYRADAHAFYQLTFPTANRSFLYDTLSGIWIETQTGVTPAYAQRHIGNLSTLFAGYQLISDYASGNLYTADPNTFTDNGQVIPRQVITKHQLEDFNEYSVDEVYVDMETGVGTLSGQGMNPMINLSVSKNNGRTWLDPQPKPIGEIGNFNNRVIWRRQGSARQFTFKLDMTDPVKFVLTSEADSRRTRKQ